MIWPDIILEAANNRNSKFKEIKIITIHFTNQNYYMSKKQWPILYGRLPHKMGHHFLDTQYVSAFVQLFCTFKGLSFLFYDKLNKKKN